MYVWTSSEKTLCPTAAVTSTQMYKNQTGDNESNKNGGKKTVPWQNKTERNCCIWQRKYVFRTRNSADKKLVLSTNPCCLSLIPPLQQASVWANLTYFVSRQGESKRFTESVPHSAQCQRQSPAPPHRPHYLLNFPWFQRQESTPGMWANLSAMNTGDCATFSPLSGDERALHQTPRPFFFYISIYI